MTREQYATAVDTIMKTSAELLKTAKSNEEALNIIIGQNLQIQALTDEYIKNNN